MTLQVSVPCKEQRMIVPVYNASTAAVIKANTAVRLVTSTTVNQVYSVSNVGATAGGANLTFIFGVCESQIATGGVGECVIHGPAEITAASAITVKSPVCANPGTAAIRGRSTTATIVTAGGAVSSKYLGWAMTVGATGSTHVVFVNTPHAPIA